MEQYRRRETHKRALDYLHAIKSRWNAYQEEVDAWYRHGEGKTEGYRFPYCFHGTSQWTDWDNICGGCEDSFNGYNPMAFYRWALDKAHQDYHEHKRRSEWLCNAPADLYGNQDLYRSIIDWCMEPIRGEVNA